MCQSGNVHSNNILFHYILLYSSYWARKRMLGPKCYTLGTWSWVNVFLDVCFLYSVRFPLLVRCFILIAELKMSPCHCIYKHLLSAIYICYILYILESSHCLEKKRKKFNSQGRSISSSKPMPWWKDQLSWLLMWDQHL